MSFELTTLGEYISIQGGYAYKSQQFIENSTYPVLKIKNIRTGYVDFNDCAYIDKKVADETERYIVSEGDILISLTGSGPNAPQSLVGRVARFWNKEKRAWINQRVGRIVLKKDKTVHKDFIFYFLGTNESQNYLVANSSGSANQANINGAIIEALPFPQIDYSTSAKISQVLRTFDEKINLNNQINQTLESIVQAIFKSWFIDFEPVRAKILAKQEGKDSKLAAMCAISGKSEAELEQMSSDDFAELQATAALFPDELMDSEFGEVPKGWEVSMVGEQVQTVGGGTPSTKNADFWDNGIHYWTTPKDLSNLTDKILLNTERKITDAGLKKISSGLLPKDTVLMSSRAPVGYLALSKIEVAINQGYIAILPNMKYSAEYLIQWCKANMAEIKGRASGTTFQEISKKNFREISFVCPYYKVVDAYTKMVKTLYDEITLKAKENQSLINLRDTLLPKLLSGEISLNKNKGSIHD